MSRYPRVSVLIPAYNSSKTIIRALSSVAIQTLQPIEVIVVDDGSTDTTVSLVKEFSRNLRPASLRLITLGVNHGPAYARNVAWDATSGNLLALLDSDDSWHPRKLEIQATYMAEHAELALTGHRCGYMPEGYNEERLGTIAENWTSTRISAWQLMTFSQFLTPTAMLNARFPYRFDVSNHCCDERMLFLEVSLNKHAIERLELTLAYIHKAPYGEGGITARLWDCEKSELRMFSQLRQRGYICRGQAVLMRILSIVKYFRRVLICLLRKHIGYTAIKGM